MDKYTAEDFGLEESECYCEKCIRMCYRPCWGFLCEVQEIFTHFPDALMLDYWVSEGEIGYTEILCPAITGYENSVAPEVPKGKCIFLTEKNRCFLHNLKLKPFEARVIDCRKGLGHEYVEMRKAIVQNWGTDDAKSFVKIWKTMKGVEI